MKVTVCEMRDDARGFAEDWAALAAHTRVAGSECVLLPEMPFCPWFALTKEFSAAVWQNAVEAHASWLLHLPELGVPVVLGTRPVNRNGVRLNEGFMWQATQGYQAVHDKYYLPEDEGFWEASWYQRGAGSLKWRKLVISGLGW